MPCAKAVDTRREMICLMDTYSDIEILILSFHGRKWFKASYYGYNNTFNYIDEGVSCSIKANSPLIIGIKSKEYILRDDPYIKMMKEDNWLE